MDNEALKNVKKSIKYTILITAGCFLASFFCFFIHQMWIPLGFALGTLIAVINMIILYEFSYYLTRPYAKPSLLSILSYGIRMFLFALGFLICILLDYFGFKIFFWGTCLASYMISIIVLVFINRK